MEIVYQKKFNDNKDKLKDYPSKRRINPEGKTLQEIETLELALNNGEPFPKAFREYLFIGGKNNAIGFNDGTDGAFVEMKTYYTKGLKERGVSIDRPFVVFHAFESAFSFIYLDEGDNPQPWNASTSEAYDTDDDEWLWKTPFSSFTEIVDHAVDSALKGVGPW